MAVTDQQIRDYLAANPTASIATVAALMAQNGVTVQQMASATGKNVNAIIATATANGVLLGAGGVPVIPAPSNGLMYAASATTALPSLPVVNIPAALPAPAPVVPSFSAPVMLGGTPVYYGADGGAYRLVNGTYMLDGLAPGATNAQASALLGVTIPGANPNAPINPGTVAPVVQSPNVTDPVIQSPAAPATLAAKATDALTITPPLSLPTLNAPSGVMAPVVQSPAAPATTADNSSITTSAAVQPGVAPSIDIKPLAIAGLAFEALKLL
jgi:hypothetical protein